MRKLLKYLKGYVKESIIGPLFKMLEASFELFVPLIMANIVDVGIRTEDTAYIWRMCAVLVFLGVLGLTCSLTAQYFAAKASMGLRNCPQKRSVRSHQQPVLHGTGCDRDVDSGDENHQ